LNIPYRSRLNVNVFNSTVKVSFLARDRERDREREFFLVLTFHNDHFGICQEYTWGRHGTVRS